jgi:DNA repair exonuclease SbcCD nuclease subunit
MKILAIGDQHFKLDNIIQVDIFIQKLKKHLDFENYDVIVSGGDLLDTHERLHTQCLNKAIEYLKVLSSHCKTFVLVGNHDMINPSQFLTTNHWLNVVKEWDKNIYNITVIDKPEIYRNAKSGITLCPYVPDGMFVEALNTIPITEEGYSWKNTDIVFGHQTMNGVKMGAIVAENVEEWDENNPMMVSFHVHDMQRVSDNLFYTGSSMQHSFSENIKKYLMKIYVNEDVDLDDDKIAFVNGDVCIKKLDIGVPKRKVINCNTKDLDNMKVLSDLIPSIYRNDMYILKVVVSGSITEFKQVKKKEIVKKLMGKYKVIFKQEVRQILNKDELGKECYDKKLAFRDMFEYILKDEVGDNLYKMYLEL